MNYRPLIALAVVLTAALVVQSAPADDRTCSCGTQSAPTGGDQQAAGQQYHRDQFKLPKMFDFDTYKSLFHKKYSSVLEEITRRKYLLAKALRSVISAIKYKRSVRSSYLGVNHLSDRGPKELARMRNKELVHATLGKLNGTRRATGSVLQDDVALRGSLVPEIDPQQVEGELYRLTTGSSDDPAYQLIRDELQNAHARRKRELSQRRELPLDSLINVGQNVKLNKETKRKMAKPPPESNNPDYVQPELMSMGLRTDKAEELNWFMIDGNSSPADLQESADTLIKRSLELPAENSVSLHDEPSGDRLTIDHRSTNCFHLPRDQGECGSCYAFTAVSLFEWLYCMKTGTLVAFSEQYLIDCGQAVGNNGCDGGEMYATGKFVHNYGLELRVHYPYKGLVDQCPYHDDTEPKQMGYLRMDLSDAIVVPLSLFEDYLQVGPIMIAISSTGDFLEYAGGVHEGDGCDPKVGDHAMLLVGQGRQDGLDYWLIRNSHSIGWGEGGYYKLWKGSKCIVPDHGVMYGTRDGLNYPFQVSENAAHDEHQLRRHFSRKPTEEV